MSQLRMMMVLGAALLGAAPLALADSPPPAAALADAKPAPAPPTKVRGLIKEVTDTAITLVKKSGKEQVLQIGPQLSVQALVKASLADIKQGVFIGTTARPDKNGDLVAVEVHIFPESMRGAGEGHYPWDLTPDSSMTNASVTDMVKAVHGQTLTLTYKGGETKVTVPPSASIVAVAPGTKADLKKGAKLFAIASEQADGSLKAGFVIVGRGVSPPM